ncbi:MAG: hypothetical protein A2052_02430 [Deltaproteobacteria bacterium GWA2_54_12]|nr:MAG: hypothetical protein A2052_02430 [Deltaproteobacteria bacterium GWA2_54_12]
MKSPFKSLSSFQKFFITLSILFIVAIIDYQTFLAKSRKVELYDEMSSRITSVRVAITKLEYLIDMFTVARRFEGGTIELIKGDVAAMNENITGLVENPKYSEVWKKDAILAEGMRTMSDDWVTIKAEIKRLNDAMTQDEVMLIHNAVDMNTVLANEKAERLIAALSERRHAVFNESKSLALRTIIGFVLLMLVMSLVYYKKVISPLSKASIVVRRILAGDSGARFQEGSGAMGAFGAELNLMAESIDKRMNLKALECAGMQTTLQEKSIQIVALASIMSFAGRSLSQNEVFGYALGEAAAAASADSGAVYMLEGGLLKLKATAGLDDRFAREAGTLGGFPGGRPGSGSAVLDNIAMLEEPLRGALMAAGAQLAASVPLVYNNEAAGLLLVAYRNPERFNSEQLRFFEAVAASIAVASGHSNLFQREHSTRKFFERLLAQLPVGLAVFASDGRCSLMSAQARRMLGADPGMEPCAYSVFEDELLASQGILTTIRKSYEGYSTEFIINYSPMSSRALGITMAPVRLRIRSFPLYDAGGEISNVALLYEDLTGTAEAPGGRT